jgi:hypothetical protein
LVLEMQVMTGAKITTSPKAMLAAEIIPGD